MLEESQRDRRLSSVSSREVGMNGHRTPNEMKSEGNHVERMSMKQLAKVECQLKQAQWSHVNLRFFFLLELYNYSYSYRMDHFLFAIFNLMLNLEILSVS